MLSLALTLCSSGLVHSLWRVFILKLATVTIWSTVLLAETAKTFSVVEAKMTNGTLQKGHFIPSCHTIGWFMALREPRIWPKRCWGHFGRSICFEIASFPHHMIMIRCYLYILGQDMVPVPKSLQPKYLIWHHLHTCLILRT